MRVSSRVTRGRSAAASASLGGAPVGAAQGRAEVQCMRQVRRGIFRAGRRGCVRPAGVVQREALGVGKPAVSTASVVICRTSEIFPLIRISLPDPGTRPIWRKRALRNLRSRDRARVYASGGTTGRRVLSSRTCRPALIQSGITKINPRPKILPYTPPRRSSLRGSVSTGSFTGRAGGPRQDEFSELVLTRSTPTLRPTGTRTGLRLVVRLKPVRKAL